MLTLINMLKLMLVACHSNWADLFRVKPVYVFHHIPKCGGTSLMKVLRRWFILVRDYVDEAPLAEFQLKRHDLSRLRTRHCLCGHFDIAGCYLHERYPQVVGNKEFRLFTFVRDPLELKISLYFYERKMGRQMAPSLIQRLFEEQNYLSRRFPCTSDNYQEVLDRYFFIGITEHLQDSLDQLADMLGKRRLKVPRLNAAERDNEYYDLSPEVISAFRAANPLDYRIYDYCLQRFLRNSPAVSRRDFLCR
jgi:hypothetical protein